MIIPIILTPLLILLIGYAISNAQFHSHDYYKIDDLKLGKKRRVL